MSVLINTKIGTRVTHPIGGAGTIVAYDVKFMGSWSPDWFFVLFDKTKNKKPWLVKRFELTQIYG